MPACSKVLMRRQVLHSDGIMSLPQPNGRLEIVKVAFTVYEKFPTAEYLYRPCK